jgi:hypothetical protein
MPARSLCSGAVEVTDGANEVIVGSLRRASNPHISYS